MRDLGHHAREVNRSVQPHAIAKKRVVTGDDKLAGESSRALDSSAIDAANGRG
jgi:hypothetical protein